MPFGLRNALWTSRRQEGVLHNIPKENSPFEIIHIDYFGLLDNTSKTKGHILVIIDAFSKFVRLYPTEATSCKEVFNALKDYFRAYSYPRCIKSDSGSCFTSEKFKIFLEDRNVRHLNSTSSPQANGQVEREIGFGPMISKMVQRTRGKRKSK